MLCRREGVHRVEVGSKINLSCDTCSLKNFGDDVLYWRLDSIRIPDPSAIGKSGWKATQSGTQLLSPPFIRGHAGDVRIVLKDLGMIGKHP